MRVCRLAGGAALAIVPASMANDNGERAGRLERIARGEEDVCIIEVQVYGTDGRLSGPQIVGWAIRRRVEEALSAVASEYAARGIDVIVGRVDGAQASDDDWNDLIEHLHSRGESDEVEAVCLLRAQMMAGGRCDADTQSWLPEEWEDVALNPDVLYRHGGPQPTGDDALACETCGGTGRVRHPVIAGYFGDCPDCGGGDLVM